MTADQLENGLTLSVLGLLAIIACIVIVPHARLALALFIGGIAFAPVWLGANLSGLVTIHTALAALALVSLVVDAYRTRSRAAPDPRPLRQAGLHSFDIVFMLLAALTVASNLVGGVDRGQVYLVATWGLMYALGRAAMLRVGLVWIAGALTAVMTVVAVFAIIEWVTSWNPWLEFTGNSSSAFRVWGPQQFRGSQVRAEASFGHSIALGCSLAITLVLTIIARMRNAAKLIVIGLLTVALILTFSRTAYITAGLGVVLLLLCTGRNLSSRMRAGLSAILVAGATLGLIITTSAFAENEDASSDAAFYRLWLWDLVPGLRALGASSLLYRTTDGTSTVGSFASIDSAVLLYALTNGWVPAAVLCIALLIATVRLVLRGGDPALVALVAQIPAFFTVALITQYAHLVWFVAGMAVTGITQAAPNDLGTSLRPSASRRHPSPVA